MNKTQALDIAVTVVRTDAALLGDTVNFRRTTWVVDEGTLGRTVLGADTIESNEIVKTAFALLTYADARTINELASK